MIILSIFFTFLEVATMIAHRVSGQYQPPTPVINVGVDLLRPFQPRMASNENRPTAFSYTVYTLEAVRANLFALFRQNAERAEIYKAKTADNNNLTCLQKRKQTSSFVQ
jgi:hypothetical protein